MTPVKITFSGAVLAGGKSTRMGRNKALLRLDGEPLWQRQLRTLKAAGAKPVFLVQAPSQRALTHQRGVRVIRDTIRDAGPLAGLHAVLAQCESTHLAILAVDLPHISPAWFTWLAENCSPETGAVVRTPRGYEPLAAIYPQSARLAATAALTAGEYSLQKFITTLVRTRRLKVLRITATDRKQLANWNSPEDMA